MDRMDFIKLLGFGGLAFASGIKGFAGGASASAAGGRGSDYAFVQLSDTHWGFSGPKVNPDAAGTLEKAVDAVNALARQPDFVIFTGDLTHTTDDPKERRGRMARFKEIVSKLRAREVRFIPGEHDASLDRGEAYREFFGEPTYAFDHKGIHFIALDNVSEPGGVLGPAQLDWLAKDLEGQGKETPIVVFAHRPLFNLYEDWDWTTADGEKAIGLLATHPHVTVFYGHIHQENHHMTGAIAHHAAKSLIFPLPAPGSVPKRAPLPWNPDLPYQGLGLREVDLRSRKAGPFTAADVQERIQEIPVPHP
ncbi:metallophosphoesterase family protein [Mesoterricola silvestris]